MAAKDMLAAGLKCVTYANGSMHTLSDYAEMAIRTAAKRAYLQGAGEKRQEWGIATVIVNKRGGACPKCLPFVGKVMIDDVWSGGNKNDGGYPLMSAAISKGLYHPNCRDSHTTFFEGISKEESKYTKEELDRIGENYTNEQKEKYIKRQVAKYDRLSKNSLYEENKKKYKARKEEWQNRLKSIKNSKSNTKNQEWKKKYVKDLKRDKKDDKVEPIMKDITNEWKEVPHGNAKKVKDLTEYEANGTVYKVDNKCVLLDHNQEEKEIANIFSEKYGKSVQLVPRILYPQNIRTPDYLIEGEKYDLKTPIGSGKNTIYDLVRKSKAQADNFIICLDNVALGMDDVELQIKTIYSSRHTQSINEIILIKNGEILKVFKK